MSWLTISPCALIAIGQKQVATVRPGIVCPDSNPTATSENAPFIRRGRSRVYPTRVRPNPRRAPTRGTNPRQPAAPTRGT
jgi:hypothetical protein